MGVTNEVNTGVHENPDTAAAQAASEAEALALAEANERLNAGEPRETTDAGPQGDDASGEPAQRPDNIPEKFWDAEKGEVNVDALAQSYKELESGRNKTEEKPEGDAEKPADGDVDNTATPVDNAMAEYAEKGELGTETYDALSKAGIPRDMVDAYINGMQAQANEMQATAFNEVGGQERYEAMTAWAQENLDQGAIAAFNQSLQDPVLAMEAVRGLNARFSAEGSYEPTGSVTGNNKPAVGGYFRSQAEMLEAMGDPRYKTDEAFRDDVGLKMMASERAGIELF